MFWQKLALATLSTFLVVILVSLAYIITTGMFNMLAENKAASESWATREIAEIVTEDTVVYKQNIYLCGTVENNYNGFETTALIGMSHGELLKMFAIEDGWQVQFPSSAELILAKRVNEFCPIHRNYRHLGIYQDTLAVFQGPLGINTKLEQVIKSRPLTELPQSLQLKLHQAMIFYSMTAEVQAQLKQELEFSNEEKMNAVLENIDEY